MGCDDDDDDDDTGGVVVDDDEDGNVTDGFTTGDTVLRCSCGDVTTVAVVEDTGTVLAGYKQQIIQFLETITLIFQSIMHKTSLLEQYPTFFFVAKTWWISMKHACMR